MDHRFFTAMAAVCATVVFVGFAPTYYLRSFSARPPLPPLVHLHGAVSTGWILLFLTQSSLVARAAPRSTADWGLPARCSPASCWSMGWLTRSTARPAGVAPPGAPPQPGFLPIPPGRCLSFAVLASAGL